MYHFTYRYIFLRGHSAFLSQYARIIQQQWRFRASLYSQSKSDALQNLNFRYKGKLELSVLLPWLVKRDEQLLRLASGIILIFLVCASKAARKLWKRILAANTKKRRKLYPLSTQNSMSMTKYCKRRNFRVGVIFAFFALLSSSRKLPQRENKTHMPLWRK